MQMRGRMTARGGRWGDPWGGLHTSPSLPRSSWASSGQAGGAISATPAERASGGGQGLWRLLRLVIGIVGGELVVPHVRNHHAEHPRPERSDHPQHDGERPRHHDPAADVGRVRLLQDPWRRVPNVPMCWPAIAVDPPPLPSDRLH